MTRLIPRNDPEANVIAYMELEKPLKRVLKHFADRNARRMMQIITRILTASGYDGTNKATVLIRQADPSTVRALEELAQSLPDADRERFMRKMVGQIANGSLTTRNAINDVIRYGPRADADRLYAEGKDVLRQTATEGMLRGEFMVQKTLGVGWQMETPGTREVDAFLKGQWQRKDADDYLKPLSGIVKDQIETGLYLGEHPDKMAKRIQEVQNIDDVRAKRYARTMTTAVSNEAQMAQYKKDGIEKYRFCATFDERTCPRCGDLDGQEFYLKDKNPGVNAPYIHPNCRCTTVAVLGKESDDYIQRIIDAHAGDEGFDPIPYKMTYNEWKKAKVV